MSEKKKAGKKPAEEVKEEAKAAAEEQTEAAAEEGTENKDAAESQAPQEPTAEQKLAQEKDNYLRLLAEYDNFRKRSAREKELLYTQIRAETVEKFLPVYDNLERALAQETADEAYKKGVEMTMNQLKTILEALGVKIFGQAGEPFDPTLHNAVMHCEDENLGENVIAEVFQKGFSVGEKVVRFAMVRVAN